MKKQEEKRLRRFGLKQEGDGVAEGEAPEGEVTEGESEVMETGSDESEGAHSGGYTFRRWAIRNKTRNRIRNIKIF